MEVIGHQTVSNNPHPGESLLIPENLAEDFLIPGLEDLAPVHDPGHHMVKGSSGSKESGGSHGVKVSYKRKGRELARRTPRKSTNPKLRQVFCVCPLKY
jgi:hypothetical protein